MVLACVNVGAPGYTPGRDYQQTSCEGCGHSVWIGPRQMAMRANKSARVFCVICCARGGADPGRCLAINPDSGSHFDPAALNAGFDDFLNQHHHRREREGRN
jgi:hypothetical protein